MPEVETKPKDVMTLRQAASYLRISPDTLYDYLKNGKISGVAFKLGNRWRFKKDLLDQWIEKQTKSCSLSAVQSRDKRKIS
jgi:excisionase family DNA binding protein